MYTEEQLKELSKQELLEIAKSKGLVIPKNARKELIIDDIIESEQEVGGSCS